MKNNEFSNYSNEFILNEPSETRVKIVRKLNKFKKEHIVNPIRRNK